jgi:HNH endonuclease
MPRRTKVLTIDQLAGEIENRLAQFKQEASTLTLRQKVQQLVHLQYNLRCLNVTAVAAEGLSPTAAISRIKVYLQRHPREIIDGPELEVVSGISEYARRIRQLRVEEGYKIATGASPDAFSGIDLKVDQYMLTDLEVDSDAARRWHIANRIRKSTSSVQDRILEFLKENVGKIVTTEELAYVARDKKEFGRRTRELRTEEGYSIATKFSGRPDLSMGEYILLSINRIAEPHDRHIPDAVQKEVYARDESTCRNPECRYQYTPSDPRILELHHLKAHARRGSNTADNLIVLCSVCHDDVHAGRLDALKCLFTE